MDYLKLTHILEMVRQGPIKEGFDEWLRTSNLIGLMWLRPRGEV